jgi:hypothetical protein
MSDYAQLLAALTSVYAFSGDGFIDAGDSHTLGTIEPPPGCFAVLAGLDVWISGPLASVGQIILLNQITTNAFWCGPFPLSDYEVAAGAYRNYRGGYILGEGGQIDIQYLQLAGTGSNVNYAYWGYYAPAGWNPVGLPPQQ